MVNFLILANKYPDFTKRSLDLGEIPHDLYSICSIIRECFCLSYSLRKGNRLFFFFAQSKTLIKFEGRKLRFLGSDERSQAVLLLKAFKKGNEGTNIEWEESTPGIFIKKIEYESSLLTDFTEDNNGKLIFILNEPDNFNSENLEELGILSNFSYIIPSHDFSLNTIKLENEIKKSENQLKFLYLPKIKRIENKVLFINFRIDQQENV